MSASTPDKASSTPAAADANDQAWQRVRFRRRRRHLVTAALLALGVLVFLWILPAGVQAALWRGAHANPTLVALPVLFSLIALSLLWTAGQGVDSWVFLALNRRGVRPAWLDWLMLGLTQFGSGYFLPVLVLALLLFGDRRLAYGVVLGTLTLWLFVELVKAVVGRSRPSVRHTQARIVGFKQPGRSFPSGHTSQSFFLVTVLIQHYGLAGWAAFGLYLLAALVGLTRMYVGAHYPRDVLAGAALGTLWGLTGGVVDLRFLAGIR